MAGEVRPHSYLGRRLGDVFCMAFNIGVWRQPMDCSVVVEPSLPGPLSLCVALRGTRVQLSTARTLIGQKDMSGPERVHGESAGFMLAPFLVRP